MQNTNLKYLINNLQLLVLIPSFLKYDINRAKSQDSILFESFGVSKKNILISLWLLMSSPIKLEVENGE